ncbi:MAG: hypothetical protein QOE06_2846 [Thermoleophilaceae bacterium]|jgi:4-amino-4-deoxy-L-arabinose transferase-like glycosyltransferase|nr:hypothetical protein [Thermoleophilaceae bacterium]
MVHAVEVSGITAARPAARTHGSLSRARALVARPGRVAWTILLVALAARVADVLLTDFVPIFDPGDYARHARSLSEGHGYPGSLISGVDDPTALRMPLYPLFLAAIDPLTGDRWELARLAQALLGTVTVGLIGLIGTRLFSRRVGLVAMALAAVFPPFIVLTGTLMSENLLLPLELGALLALLEHLRSDHRYRWAAVAGVLSGLAMLTRPNAAVLLLALVLGILSTRPRHWRGVAVLVVAAAIVYAPWPIRNAVTLKEFVPVSTEFGLVAESTYNDYSAHLGKKPGVWVAPWQQPPGAAQAILADKSLSEPEMDRRLTAEARHFVRHHPTYPAEVGFWNSMRLLHITQPNQWWYWQNLGLSRNNGAFTQWGFYPVLLLALVGIFLPGVTRAPRWIWLTPILMWVSLVFVNNEPRARAPIDPYFLLLAALGAVALWDRLRRREPAAAPA